MYQKNVTLPQLHSNPSFPKAISDYIIKTNPKDVSGDAFVLLSEIYMSSSFKEVIYVYLK
jgi:hypothetical protein